MENNLEVYRYGGGQPLLIGRLFADGSFEYDAEYAADSMNLPVSSSLPISTKRFTSTETEPFFEGLVPEGAARRLMSAELHVREDDWLAMLHACGLDCVGDLPITTGALPEPPVYESVSTEELRELFSRQASMAELNGSERLSLAGTQSKVGLAHIPEGALDSGWFRCLTCAAATHILKVGSKDKLNGLEFLCTRAASLCGIESAEVHLIDFGVSVLCSRRFDRTVGVGPNALQVKRLHQEDLTQAFGLTSGSKYAELEGGSIRRIARFLYEQSDDAMGDIRRLARLVCFNYAIGNCDAHLKNLSIMYGEGRYSPRLRMRWRKPLTAQSSPRPPRSATNSRTSPGMRIRSWRTLSRGARCSRGFNGR